MRSKEPAQQAGVLVAGRSVATLAEVLAPLIIVRILGKADVGVLTALLLVYTTLSMILTAGLPGTLSFHLPSRRAEERRAIVWTMIKLLGWLALLAVVIQLSLAWLSQVGLFSQEIGLVYLAALIGLPLGDIPMRILTNMLVIEGHDRAAASMPIIRSLGLTLGTLVPLALGMDVWMVMVILSGVGLVFAVITYGYYRMVYGREKKVSSPLSGGDLLRFAIPVGLTEMVSNLNSKFDRFLIIPLGMIAYAEYGAGSWQIPIIPSITYAVGVAYAPRFAEMFKAGAFKEVVAMWRQQASKTALLVVPLSMIFVVAAEETIEIFFTADYLNGASVFRLYAIMTMGRITAFGSVLIAAGNTKYVLRSALIAFASNIVISVPLVLLMGFNGPALGTLLAFIPMVCGYSWHIGKATGVPFRNIFPVTAILRVLAAVSVPAALALLFKFNVDLPAVQKLGIEMLIIVAGYVAIGTVFKVLTRSEWEFVKEFLLLKIFRKQD